MRKIELFESDRFDDVTECTTCGGEGSVRVTCLVKGRPGWVEVHVCATCGGAGYLPVYDKRPHFWSRGAEPKNGGD